MMLMFDVNSKSYSDISFHNEAIKSFTRNRYDKIYEDTQYRQSVSRLVTILFHELDKLVPSFHVDSI